MCWKYPYQVIFPEGYFRSFNGNSRPAYHYYLPSKLTPNSQHCDRPIFIFEFLQNSKIHYSSVTMWTMCFLKKQIHSLLQHQTYQSIKKHVIKLDNSCWQWMLHQWGMLVLTLTHSSHIPHNLLPHTFSLSNLAVTAIYFLSLLQTTPRIVHKDTSAQAHLQEIYFSNFKYHHAS